MGDSENDSLQRVNGISFPTQKALDEYKEFLQEAATRDHRKIGKVGHLFHRKLMRLTEALRANNCSSFTRCHRETASSCLMALVSITRLWNS